MSAETTWSNSPIHDLIRDARLDDSGSELAAPSDSLQFRVIAHNPENGKDEDFGTIEAGCWEDAASIVRCRFNYPKRMIPITAEAVRFPSPANAEMSE